MKICEKCLYNTSYIYISKNVFYGKTVAFERGIQGVMG